MSGGPSDLAGRSALAVGYFLGRSTDDRLPCLGFLVHDVGFPFTGFLGMEVELVPGSPHPGWVDVILDNRGFSLVSFQSGVWLGKIRSGQHPLAQTLGSLGSDRLSDIHDCRNDFADLFFLA